MEKEKKLSRDRAIESNLFLAIMVVAVAVFMIIVIYGVDTVIPGIHDLFHDFRHSVGMSCH